MRTPGSRRKTSWIATFFCSIALLQSAQAQDHVAPLSTVRQDLERATSQRATNIAEIERLLARPEAQQELAKAKLGSGQVQKAIAVMNDEELSRLAARARSADQDVQGGFIKTILAIIGAITVIVIVLAVLA
jgi:hypothetical protein